MLKIKNLTKQQLTLLAIAILLVIFALGVIIFRLSAKPAPSTLPTAPAGQPTPTELTEPEPTEPLPELTTGDSLEAIEQDLQQLNLGNLEQELNQEFQELEAQLQQLE